MIRQIIKDNNNELSAVMLILTKEEYEVFEDDIDDMLNYEDDLHCIESALKENQFTDGEDIYKKYFNVSSEESTNIVQN